MSLTPTTPFTHPAAARARTLLGGALFMALAVFAPESSAQLPREVEGIPVPSLAPMLEKVTPAVVNISTEGHVELKSNPLFNDPFFRRFFNVPDMPRERKTQSLGSGVIVDAQRGLVMTNNHVIANADQISVRLTDGRRFSAKVVGTDPETDIGVIQIKASGLASVPLANSDNLRVGDFAVAIGNPFGLGQTVTSGIISALARSGLGITGYEDLIQTDASINPGNSGGALVNLRGELVGINTAIYSQSGGNIGIGFAIPINMANQVMEQLVKYGEISRGYLGAEMQNLDPDLAAAFGLDSHNGAVLVNILSGSPAENAGLRAGDVVVSVNGRRVRDAADLRNHIGLMRVGDAVDLQILRDSKPLVVKAKVGARESSPSVAASGVRNPRLAGVGVADLDESSPYFGRVNGIVVTRVGNGTPAWKAGLRAGDLILSVNREDVADVETFVELAGRIKGQLLLGVMRGSRVAMLVIK